jgi:hypothetical protein
LTQTAFAIAAGHAPVANSSEASCTPPSTGLTSPHEYAEILADIERGPRRSLLTVLRLVLAGQYAKPTRH